MPPYTPALHKDTLYVVAVVAGKADATLVTSMGPTDGTEVVESLIAIRCQTVIQQGFVRPALGHLETVIRLRCNLKLDGKGGLSTDTATTAQPAVSGTFSLTLSKVIHTHDRCRR